MPEAQLIDTPAGQGRAITYAASRPDPLATVVLSHGAGGGLGASDLMLLARALPARGYRVVLIEQPWKVAGRRVAGRPPTLDAAWVPMVAALDLAGPLVAGGRSAGARVACRTAADVGVSGVLCLSFPLHPPGKAEASRAGELRAPGEHGIPVRVVQGERDPFGDPGEVRAELADPRWVAGVPGTHSFGSNPTEVLDAVLAFLPALSTGGSRA